MDVTGIVNLLGAFVIVILAAWIVSARAPAGSAMGKIAKIALGLIGTGVFLWLINTYIPMANSIKAILNVVVVVAACVWVLEAAGLWRPLVQLWNNWMGNLRLTDDHEPPPRLFT